MSSAAVPQMSGLRISKEHLLVALPVALVAGVGGFLVSHYLQKRCCKNNKVNTCIQKDSPKVVHSFDMEDIGAKAVYCRCWKSRRYFCLRFLHLSPFFPYCDGAHTKHNDETGDNVGPLIIKRKEA
ncbi:hypothetical protein WMY93_020316 [Mugilogobius chulae]|uniref:Iron-binding zinc finger CDGSH type domain-containing protein n=1 Tax=Mugilogobius chulae TaxID=88201 RepID=A0AAW0NJK3_9GOBI